MVYDSVFNPSRPIITLPYYVFKSLISRGCSVRTLEGIVSEMITMQETLLRENKDVKLNPQWGLPLNGLSRYVSDNDLKDLIFADVFILREFFINTKNIVRDALELNPKFKSVHYVDSIEHQQEYRDFLSYLASTSQMDMEKIIVSIENDTENSLFTYEVGDNCSFLILNVGFSNFVSCSCIKTKLEFKTKFLGRLYNFMFSKYGENYATISNNVLQQFIKLQNANLY